jgi:hypothetical protein
MAKKKVVSAPSALQRMDASINEAVSAPFNGAIITVIARRLNTVQIKSCGDFSLIETFQDKINNNLQKNKKLSYNDIVKTVEMQHSIIKESLLNPTYDEIIKVINKYDDFDNIDQQLKDIKEKFDQLIKIKADQKKIKNLQDEYAFLELRAKYVLPADFVSYMFSFAMSIDLSDIKKVNEDMLYNAACLAKLGHDNPSDHLSGAFTDYNKQDIDNRAWIIFYDKEKNKDSGKNNRKRRA